LNRLTEDYLANLDSADRICGISVSVHQDEEKITLQVRHSENKLIIMQGKL